MTRCRGSSPSSGAFLPLEKYSFGVGDRFGREAKAQLAACQLAAGQSVEVTPVWNKSQREHAIVGSGPGSVRLAADAAVRELGWRRAYRVDADHVTLDTVDAFLASCDYFTLDVADAIGKPAPAGEVESFLSRHREFSAPNEAADAAGALALDPAMAARAAAKYLVAAREAGRIYRRIAAARNPASFVTEVSMDETDSPQTPAELLLILAAVADESVPLQAIAPKFSGRFNKGVDYAGDIAQFERDFRADVAAIAHAVRAYPLPATLKLSVHSGSDKFSLFPVIRRVLAETGAGLHLKTAGTTWLEELIGMAESGGAALDLAKEIYARAYARREELCLPYAAVIDIDSARLPAPSEVDGWDSERFAGALRHDPRCARYNPSIRQLLHVGYKIAAELGVRNLDTLDACRDRIERGVTANLFERHLKPLFLGEGAPAAAP